MNVWEYIKAKAKIKEEIVRLDIEKSKQRHISDEVMGELAEFLMAKFSRLTVCTVMMYFFAPDALGGYKMRKQMRNKMADAMRCNPGYISRKRNIALFLYNNDKKFHEEVDEAISLSVDFMNNIIA